VNSKVAYLVAALLFASCRADVATDPDRHKLVQTGFRVLYMAPIYIAMEKGFFEKEKIDFSYTEIASGALGVATVISGDAHISDIDPMDVARLRDRGQSLTMFYNIVNRVTMDLVVRNEILDAAGIHDGSSLEDRYRVLEGLNIGITRPGAATDVYARFFLTKAGLDPDRDANLVQVGGAMGLDAAFRSGRIDAFLLSPPLPQTLEHDGRGRIIVRNTEGEVPELRDTPLVNFFVTSEFAAANRKALESYARAVSAATGWIRENQEATLLILLEKYFPDSSPESLQISLEAILPALNVDGRYNESEIQRYFEVFEAIGETVETSTAEGVLWTNDFIQR